MMVSPMIPFVDKSSIIDMATMDPLPIGSIFCGILFAAAWLLWFTVDLVPRILAALNPEVAGADPEEGDPMLETGGRTAQEAPTLYQLAASNKYSKLELNIPSVVLLLRQLALLGAILLMGWMNEYRPIFEHATKEPDMDYFLFLSAAFVAVALCTATKTTDSGILNRNQTEEWKGWMQMQFLMYHYLHQEETYNAIRVYISCYVWMTGFGNFSFFYTKRDFSFVRFWSMMWRLNFSVFWLCLALNNTWILYYICPLHTFFFLLVFCSMRIAEQLNHTQWGVRAKLLCLFVLVYICWELDWVWLFLFQWLPSTAQLGAKAGALHEWHFRSALDHWDCSFGMLFALNFPMMISWFGSVEALQPGKQYLTKGVMGLGCALGCLVWYKNVFGLAKFQYNALHPYTFFVPLLSYVYFRNVSKRLREYNCELLVQMGKITLETYLLQHHFWLSSNAKSVLVFVPGFNKLNFVVTTVFFVVCSHTLFRCTMSLRAMLIPNENKAAAQYLLGMLAVVVVVLALAFGLVYALPEVTALSIGVVATLVAAAVLLFLDSRLQLPQLYQDSKPMLLGTFAAGCLCFLVLAGMAAGHSIRAVSPELPQLKPLPPGASNTGHLVAGAVVVGTLCVGLWLSDNFLGLGRLASLMFGVEFPSWEDAYQSFNSKIVEKNPIQRFW